MAHPAGGPEQGREYRDGCRQAVDAIQHATVAGQQVAAVLDSGLALEHAFGEVADDRDEHHQRRAEQGQEQRAEGPAAVEADRQGDRQAGRQAAVNAFPALAGADPRRQLALAEGLAGEVGADIRAPDQHHHGDDQAIGQRPLLEQDQPLPGRQQDQQAHAQAAPASAPVADAFRVGEHQHSGQRPPDQRQQQHGSGKLRQMVESDHQYGDRRRVGNAAELLFIAGQACPFPGPQAHHRADEQGEERPFEKEKTTQRDGQEHQRRDDPLFQHDGRASASTCSLVLPKRRWRLEKSARAARIAACLKSGQNRSEKYSSA